MKAPVAARTGGVAANVCGVNANVLAQQGARPLRKNHGSFAGDVIIWPPRQFASL